MKKYRYEMITFESHPSSNVVEELNKIGDDGWLLVNNLDSTYDTENKNVITHSGLFVKEME